MATQTINIYAPEQDDLLNQSVNLRNIDKMFITDHGYYADRQVYTADSLSNIDIDQIRNTYLDKSTVIQIVSGLYIEVSFRVNETYYSLTFKYLPYSSGFFADVILVDTLQQQASNNSFIITAEGDCTYSTLKISDIILYDSNDEIIRVSEVSDIEYWAYTYAFTDKR